jgi:hypothetical protein
MSVFPRHVAPGDTVVIHCNLSNPVKSAYTLPRLRVAIIDPGGAQEEILATTVFNPTLPTSSRQDDRFDETAGIKKAVPLVVLADYLSGSRTREQLIDILRNIETGRHRYLAYPVRPDSSLGCYRVEVKTSLNGRTSLSGSAAHDSFFVERLTRGAWHGTKVDIVNEGSEPVPARVLRCLGCDCASGTGSEIVQVPAHSTLAVEPGDCLSVLLYSEDRQVIPLAREEGPFLLRDQDILWLDKGGRRHLLRTDAETGYVLEGEQAQVWDRSDGLLPAADLAGAAGQARDELLGLGLVQQIDLPTSQVGQTASIATATVGAEPQLRTVDEPEP